MVERNVEMFMAIASAIEAEPDRYDQGDWGSTRVGFESQADAEAATLQSCGTRACIAGHTAALTDWEPQTYFDRDIGKWRVHWAGVRRRGTTDIHRPVSEVAREELGLDSRESALLFAGSMTFKNGDAVKSLRMLADGAEVADVCE